MSLQFLRTLKMWNTKNIVLNVTYVEQKQMEIVTERGQMQYEFMRDDYNECLDLFATDLLKALHPTMSAIVSPNSIPIISRMIKMYKILYGNRKEIETGLVSCRVQLAKISKLRFLRNFTFFRLICMIMHLFEIMVHQQGNPRCCYVGCKLS